MTRTGTLTLAGFLLARIAEDEQQAQDCAKAYPGEWELSDRGWMAKVTADGPSFRVVAALDQKYAPSADEGGGRWLGDYLMHVAQWAPPRVLAECEAKRRIIGLCDLRMSEPDPEWGLEPAPLGGQGAEVYYDTLRLLALPYADHPDYRPQWRVDG